MHDFTFWTLIIQWSMTLQGPDSLGLARHDRLTEVDKHQTFKPVMVNVVSSIPNGDSFIWNKNASNVRFMPFTKFAVYESNILQ